MHIAIRLTRKRLALAALLATLAAAGVAYATIPDSSGVFTACQLKSVGTIRMIDPSLGSTSLLGHCTSLETQISWNQKGQNGQNGISPTVMQLAAGDSHCTAGGASLTDASGHIAYVCNGQRGADGQSFTGNFTSPNGQFSLSVADGGVNIVGPGSSISLSPAGDVTIHATNAVETVANDQSITVSGNRTESVGDDRTVTVGHDETIHVANNRTDVVDKDESLTVHGNRTGTVDKNETIKVGVNRAQTIGGDDSLNVSSTRTENIGASDTVKVGAGQSVTVAGTVDVTGSTVTINGGGACHSAARIGDLVSSTQILTGSATVCIGG